MKGIWLENQQIQLRTDIEIPEIPPGEALVRVLRAGICNTDLELLKGYYPYTGILGHEFVGVVEQGPADLINQRVVGEINDVCGNCWFCRQEQSTHCENRTVLGIVDRHGAFAEYVRLPIKNLHRLPDNISHDAATFTEPLAAALQIQQQIHFSNNHRVLVVGDGKLGQLVAQTIALTGCDLLVIGRHRDKLANLEDRGIKTGFANSVTDRAFDIAIECTGNPEGFAIAHRALRPRGTIVLKSTYAGKLNLDASALVVDEITLIGSRCGPFLPAIELLSTGKVNVEPLIQKRFPIDQGIEAFATAQTRGSLKIILEIG